MYNDNEGQTISNPNYDFDEAPEINADQMTEEEMDRYIEEQFGWQDHPLNNGPKY